MSNQEAEISRIGSNRGMAANNPWTSKLELNNQLWLGKVFVLRLQKWQKQKLNVLLPPRGISTGGLAKVTGNPKNSKHHKIYVTEQLTTSHGLSRTLCISPYTFMIADLLLKAKSQSWGRFPFAVYASTLEYQCKPSWTMSAESPVEITLRSASTSEGLFLVTTLPGQRQVCSTPAFWQGCFDFRLHR